jgi:inner membrane protein
MTETPNAAAPAVPATQARTPLFDRLGVKAILVTLLAVGLLLPLAWIGELTQERDRRRAEAIEGIHRAWGAAQLIGTPIVVVPVVDAGAISLDERVPVALAAARVDANVDLAAERRARGIFGTVVYRSTVRGQVAFASRDALTAALGGRRALWEEALLVVPVSDYRGVTLDAAVTLGGQRVALEPREGQPVPGIATTKALVAPLGELLGAGGAEINFEFGVRGSVTLQLAVLARSAEIRMASAWPDPSFLGGALPDSRRVAADGFEASWSIQLSHLPRSSHGAAGGQPRTLQLEEAVIGVALLDSVSTYRMVERAQKYDVLLIAFTFLVFFLFEALWGAKLHLVHYGLVGLALCLFYLLLLGLAELIGFAPAYALASALVVVQASLYGRSLLKSRGLAAAFAALLAAAYADFFVLLTLESYALIAGALALFAGLSAVMFVTRRVDWAAASATRRFAGPALARAGDGT